MREVGQTWTLGGVNITVEKDSGDYPEIRFSKHSVLDSTITVLQLAGTETDLRKITGIIYSGYENQFMQLIGSGYYTLVSDQGSEGNYFIQDCQDTRLQNLRRDNPTYRVIVTLKKEMT